MRANKAAALQQQILRVLLRGAVASPFWLGGVMQLIEMGGKGAAGADATSLEILLGRGFAGVLLPILGSILFVAGVAPWVGVGMLGACVIGAFFISGQYSAASYDILIVALKFSAQPISLSVMLAALFSQNGDQDDISKRQNWRNVKTARTYKTL